MVRPRSTERPLPDSSFRRDCQSTDKDVIISKGDSFERDFNRLKQLREKKPDCPNVHNPPDQGGGVHFKVKHVGKGSEARKKFTDGVRRQSIKQWKEKGFETKNSDKVNHKTPLDAGGGPCL